MKQSKNKNHSKLLYWLGGALILLLGFAFVGKHQGWLGQSKAVEVTFDKVTRRTVVEKVSASGDIRPEIEVELSPDVAGEIIELNVEEGDSVVQGQLLIKIRPDNFESAVERSQANLNQQLANLADAKARLSRARAQYERSKLEYDRNVQLHQQDAISQADLESAEVNFKIATHDRESAEQNVEASKYIVESARATLREAKENLRLTSVLAPMSGIISKLSVEKGERVVGTQQMAGTAMLRIADLRQMEVMVDVNENDIVRIAVGDTAIIDVDAYGYLDKEFKGIVSQIANTANPKPSSEAVTEFEVRIRILKESYQGLEEIDNGRYPFKPGMTASVDIITDRKENVLTIPLSAVTMRNPADTTTETSNGNLRNSKPEEIVFVNRDYRAIMTVVKTGISDFDFIEIIEGLEEDQAIISGPFQAVSTKLKHMDRLEEMERD